MDKEQYLGVSVSPYTYDEIIADLKKRIAAGEQSTVIAVNPEKVITAGRDPLVKELINESTYQIADGIGMIIASKLKKGQLKERVTGVDMMGRLLQFAADEGHGVFFYGAKEEVVRTAKEKLEAKIPNLRVAGYANGYVQDQEALVQAIRESGATLLFVALGSPRQELWIKENMPKLPNVKVFQGVGGSFDVYSGKVKRAPAFYRKFGLEWLYRLMKEPKRLKRQMALPKFLLKILIQK
ncbi:WecB/TagA/CpsF family glycosyltransferase [Pseudobacillus badius]|uniref:WecB/TagA/CpsF family glycosyltransferase n=1 Tax=Bacillus badius TaxID=1455 RepID=UPI0007B03CD4|nr:WecB/TagA/CpsF family glycosyltransferase [Bacillus badius]KZN99978.1 N-acetylmannosaminyltransferase [Bacillus badius]OCS86143.1 N-acetylmannosaminyltransferase [Bacillus badius]OVE52396.1 glycosyltransferase [Bacillus badius]TDW04132.1 N-acetylglucosaminyldiphosphoundecaprenol N-acetyl-beta-D-mannosaminyltransferase [Bacillus badius]UAT30510.1 WecB/TagA/CpsF family glycosyltransferase [Bacillus badius]